MNHKKISPYKGWLWRAVSEPKRCHCIEIYCAILHKNILGIIVRITKKYVLLKVGCGGQSVSRKDMELCGCHSRRLYYRKEYKKKKRLTPVWKRNILTATINQSISLGKICNLEKFLLYKKTIIKSLNSCCGLTSHNWLKNLNLPFFNDKKDCS